MAFPSLHTAVCFSAFEKGNIHVGYKALKNERILRGEIEFLTYSSHNTFQWVQNKKQQKLCVCRCSSDILMEADGLKMGFFSLFKKKKKRCLGYN